MAKDMTHGSPVKLILAFSIPLLIGNIFQQLYSMVDTIIVGRFIGVDALAAVGATGSLSFLLIGFVSGLTSGFSVVTSQRFGANDKTGLKKSIAVTLTLSVITTIIITVLSVASVEFLLKLMKTPNDIIDGAYSYISVIYGGIGATIFYNMLSGILRAIGDSKTPLYFLIIASILNIILDIVFIVNFSMGVAGVAYATIISQVVSGLLCLIYMLKKYDVLRLEKQHWRFSGNYVMRHLKIAIPMALQFSITAIGVMVLQSSINSFGSITVAAYTAASKVEQLIIQPCVSFGVAIATYCGQNFGAGKIDRIKEGVKKCTIITLVFSAIGGVLVVLFGKEFVEIFVSGAEVEVITTAKQYLNTVAIFFPILSVIFIYRNALQGIGDSFIPMMAGVGELVARTVAAFTLPSIIGFAGICIAGPLAWIAATVILAIAYFRKIREIDEHDIEIDSNKEIITSK